MLPGRLAKNGVGGGGGRGLLAGRLISSSLWYITGRGGSRDFFLVVEPNFSSNGTVGLFVANYFSQRRPRVSQSVNANRQLGTP